MMGFGRCMYERERGERREGRGERGEERERDISQQIR